MRGQEVRHARTMELTCPLSSDGLSILFRWLPSGHPSFYKVPMDTVEACHGCLMVTVEVSHFHPVAIEVVYRSSYGRRSAHERLLIFMPGNPLISFFLL